MDQNVNYYGIILLLRQLRESGSFSEKELRRVAARIAADSGADIMISLRFSSSFSSFQEKIVVVFVLPKQEVSRHGGKASDRRHNGTGSAAPRHQDRGGGEAAECAAAGNVSSELITAIYAAFAQKESESISGNMRWSYQRRMEAGTFLPPSAPYGYRIINKEIEIDPEQAVTIRKIFQWHLDGNSKERIARRLNEVGILSGQNKEWGRGAIHYILTNERYPCLCPELKHKTKQHKPA